MKELLEKLLDNHIAELKQIRKHVNITPLDTVLKFNTSENNINKGKIEQIKRKEFLIYVIKTKEKLTYEEAVKGYDKLKEEGYGAFRVKDEENEKHFKYWKNKTGEKCLYVGSSQDIRKRLKEHLGIMNNKGELIGKTTYALHLSAWFINKKISIELYEAYNKEEMQLFEDLLWDEFKPLLGKKGRK